MTIIDHRILIPASQDKVWLHISDLTRNPNWQVDCKAVSMLTTMRSGPGTRWRCTSRSGHDYVLEATAWYDRLGYEYRIVDGVSYQSNKGLIRLQEVPEGTIVQWTFTYELSGLLSGLQNSLSTRRRVENEIIDGLRGLYRYVSKSADGEVLQAKSLMRDAPDVEARAHYRPRHPAAVELPPSTSPSMMAEPPVAQDDTRPNAVVQKADTGEIREPDFLTNVSKTETGLSAVVENTPTNEVAAGQDPYTAYKPPEASAPPAETDEAAASTVTRQSTVPSPAPATEPGHPPVETPPSAVTRVTPPVPASSTPESEPGTPEAVDQPDLSLLSLPSEDISDLDTAKVSVFELFGLPKPSETQEMKAVPPAPSVEDGPTVTIMPPAALKTQSTTVAAIVDVDKTEPFWHRIGLRLRLRRKSVTLRRP